MKTSQEQPSQPSQPSSRARLTVPNLISALRLATVPVFVFLFVTGRENAAVVVYGVVASTDWVDGYVARRTGAISELGKLLDPLADRVFIVALAVALVARGTLPWWLAAGIVGRDLIVLGLFPVMSRRGVGLIPVNLVGKSATAALFVGLTWLALSETSFGWADIGDEIGLAFTWLGAGLYWIAGGLYAREARRRWKQGRRVSGGDGAAGAVPRDRQDYL